MKRHSGAEVEQIEPNQRRFTMLMQRSLRSTWPYRPHSFVRLYCKQHNLRRDAKANRQNAGADAGGHEHVMAALKNVAGGVFASEARRHDRRSDQRNIHLPTMCVSRK